MEPFCHASLALLDASITDELEAVIKDEVDCRDEFSEH